MCLKVNLYLEIARRFPLLIQADLIALHSIPELNFSVAYPMTTYSVGDCIVHEAEVRSIQLSDDLIRICHFLFFLTSQCVLCTRALINYSHILYSLSLFSQVDYVGGVL